MHSLAGAMPPYSYRMVACSDVVDVPHEACFQVHMAVKDELSLPASGSWKHVVIPESAVRA